MATARRTLPILAIALALVAALVAPADRADAQDPQTFESDPVLAAGVNGPVWASELVGDELWVGGTFTSARDYTFNSPTLTTRNLAVININTGQLEDKTFDFDGPVYGIEYHDFTVWVVGNFDNVNGEFRKNIVALDALTGEIKPAFVASSNTRLLDLSYHDGWLYLGGNISAYNGVFTPKVLRVDPVTGVRDSSWAPNVTLFVEAIDTYGDFIVAAERADVSGVEAKLIRISTGQKVEGLDPDSGERLWDAKFDPTGTRVYTADGGNAVNAHTIDDDLLWVSPEAEGDMQAVASTNTQVFAGFHEGFDGNPDRRIVALDPDDGDVDESWYVEMNSYWGVRDIEVFDQGLIVAGEFTNVNGINSRRVAIFRPTDPWVPAEPLVDPNVGLTGDVTCDDAVDDLDALAILEFGVANLVDGGPCPVAASGSELDAAAGDVDDDDSTGLRDALLIAQCDAGLPNEFCP